MVRKQHTCCMDQASRQNSSTKRVARSYMTYIWNRKRKGAINALLSSEPNRQSTFKRKNQVAMATAGKSTQTT